MWPQVQSHAVTGITGRGEGHHGIRLPRQMYVKLAATFAQARSVLGCTLHPPISGGPGLLLHAWVMAITAHPPSRVQYCNRFRYSDAMFCQPKPKWSLMMRMVKVLTIATAFAVIFSLPVTATAQDAAGTFKAKCAGCHGADGTGSAMGKKMGAHDFTTADVQKMSDAELSDIIVNGKNKMPKYGSLKPEEVKGLVAYIRTLKK